MKKLLVLALSAMLVLAFASISMAATVTVGGELNFGKTFEANTNINEAIVSVTAQIADDVKAFIKLKTGDAAAGTAFVADDAYVEFTEDYGKITIKKGDYNKTERDIISNAVAAVGTDGLTAVYETKLSDQVTLNVVASNMEEKFDAITLAQTQQAGLEYGFSLAYDADNFGMNGSFFRNSINDDTTAYIINGYVKFDALKLFLTWGNDNEVSPTPATKMLVVGGVYDSADVPFYGRAEYDFEQSAADHNWAIRVGYKVTSNYKFEYQYKHDSGVTSPNFNEQYLKLNVTF